jgi:hypothetical protein
MKSINISSFSGKLFSALAAVFLIFAINSCARKMSFNTSLVVPAARGTVKVKKDNNSNYNIQISLSNLAEPNRLQPSKSSYVVWMESDNNAAKNIGMINSSTGFMSNKLKASFETVSSTKPTKIFLTAEDDGNVQYPASQVILSTDNF